MLTNSVAALFVNTAKNKNIPTVLKMLGCLLLQIFLG